MFIPAIILLFTRRINNLFTEYNIKNISKELSIHVKINNLMDNLLGLEYKLQKQFYIPFGSSIFCIATYRHEN